MEPLSSLSKIWNTRSTKKGWRQIKVTHFLLSNQEWSTWSNWHVHFSCRFVSYYHACKFQLIWAAYIFRLDDAFETAECDLPMVAHWLLENLRRQSTVVIITTTVTILNLIFTIIISSPPQSSSPLSPSPSSPPPSSSPPLSLSSCLSSCLMVRRDLL